MAAAIASYSHDHFHSLPSVKEAHERFVNIKGQGHVEWFKKFFVASNMDRRFGLAMIHRHFDLEHHEKLVEYKGTSIPWSGGFSGMKEPQPAMWSFDDKGVLRPIEFYYSEAHDGNFAEKDLELIAKFKTELALRGLDNVFGLVRYPGDKFDGSCEFSQGRANINLQPKDYPAVLKAFSTIWFFSEPLWKRGCTCKCNEVSSDHPHTGHRTTQRT
ncbi:uncharacterized protein UV8b_04509 [Ustilaginoidea virens]|uniref:Uncharacterized protein n=1 Tax=Ustilaginoidea virens TaxID=1159556 RepID=A0A1B5L808_USTVR|nr:uncharacterized protein UV8b_04509 [Ustilaginoidea virens]QUC20268.1 hypothetical protein UV8b_04509 [Ustilaginoidea virens]GAO19842.1 hypothetical protein UVI_02062960 [Ustilaginoidea virens]